MRTLAEMCPNGPVACTATEDHVSGFMPLFHFGWLVTLSVSIFDLLKFNAPNSISNNETYLARQPHAKKTLRRHAFNVPRWRGWQAHLHSQGTRTTHSFR